MAIPHPLDPTRGRNLEGPRADRPALDVVEACGGSRSRRRPQREADLPTAWRGARLEGRLHRALRSRSRSMARTVRHGERHARRNRHLESIGIEGLELELVISETRCREEEVEMLLPRVIDP